MIDADKDGVVSYQDFREKIWNLRWFIEPAKVTTGAAPIVVAQSMEEVCETREFELTFIDAILGDTLGRDRMRRRRTILLE